MNKYFWGKVDSSGTSSNDPTENEINDERVTAKCNILNTFKYAWWKIMPKDNGMNEYAILIPMSSKDLGITCFS